MDKDTSDKAERERDLNETAETSADGEPLPPGEEANSNASGNDTTSRQAGIPRNGMVDVMQTDNAAADLEDPLSQFPGLTDDWQIPLDVLQTNNVAADLEDPLTQFPGLTEDWQIPLDVLQTNNVAADLEDPLIQFGQRILGNEWTIGDFGGLPVLTSEDVLQGLSDEYQSSLSDSSVDLDDILQRYVFEDEDPGSFKDTAGMNFEFDRYLFDSKFETERAKDLEAAEQKDLSTLVPPAARNGRAIAADPRDAETVASDTKDGGAGTSASATFDYDPPQGPNPLKMRAQVSGPKKLRCHKCKKRVGLTAITCRCGQLFCGLHRYVNEHDCPFDYRAMGAEEIRKNNPLVVAEKVKKI